MVSKVEEYDSIHAEDIAAGLIAKQTAKQNKNEDILSDEELTEVEQMSFVLNDGDANKVVESLEFDHLVSNETLANFNEDMASDDEILAAEMDVDSSDLSLDINMIKGFSNEISTDSSNEIPIDPSTDEQV